MDDEFMGFFEKFASVLEIIAGAGVFFLGGILIMGAVGWDCTLGMTMIVCGGYFMGDGLTRLGLW